VSGPRATDVLLVIDAIDLFEHEDAGKLLDSFRSRLQGLQAVIATARANGVPVIYVNDHHGRWDGDATGLVEAACSGPGSDVIQAVRPRPGEAFLFKAHYSAFDHTLLELLLAELDAERLILVGATTEGCVVQSGIDAREVGFKVTIVADGCASIDAELEQLALRYARDVVGIQVEGTAGHLTWRADLATKPDVDKGRE
jgi:nicotinamidase-related amidase